MHNEFTANTDGNATALNVSRRTLLQFAAVGSAAALPAVAMAETTVSFQSSPLSDEEQLDSCIAQLEAILARMRPNVVEQSHFFQKCPDGSYHLSFSGCVPLAEFSGDGFYHISVDGYPTLFHVQKETVFRSSAKTPYSRYKCQRWEEGKPFDHPRYMSDPYFLRKLDGPADLASCRHNPPLSGSDGGAA